MSGLLSTIPAVMTSENGDETTQFSVSSLKSRFEQLATKDGKNGLEEKGTLHTRPSSQDRTRTSFEDRSKTDGIVLMGMGS